ncbi:MAG: type IV secretion system DNA-binding domain-containing protein [bacterium]|nr:type IV secretion system DNA-binding domain-containing protein [bacterium]
MAEAWESQQPELGKNVVYFGKTDFRNDERLFGIKRKDRRQHMYIVGKTGTGKSVLINNLIIQDISNGDGVCVVDPHGELVEGVLSSIPKSREKDIIYFNPADTEFPIGFNVLELPDPKYKHLVASGLMGIFTKIWSNVWSARMEYILNNAILALLDTPNTTLLGIPRLLVDKEYRQKIINNLKDPVVKAFWVNEYEEWQDKFRNEAIAPIQNKVGQFLSTAIVRNVVGQSRSTINIFDLMNSQKIFLVNVSKGRIGEDNAALLGAMIITKIQLSAMERVRIPEENRKDFYLYVDEFQNFATDSFANVLSEARKYRLDLIIAHQYVGQLVTDVSTKVRDAVFGNVGTMVVFRVGAADAEFLESEFEPEFTIQDIVNLPNYRIYLKLMVDGVTSRPFSAATLPPLKMKTDVVSANEVVDGSRRRYAKSRQEVEDEVYSWSTGSPMGVSEEGASAGGSSGAGSKKIAAGLHSAVCSSCGKETKVPFKPIAGRPVFCSECYAKAKAGEISLGGSERGSRPAKESSSSVSNLADIGIEFESLKSFDRPQKREGPSPSLPRGTREMPPRPRAHQTLTLSDLKATQSPINKEVKLKTLKPSKTSPDVGSIKEALKEALKKKNN